MHLSQRSNGDSLMTASEIQSLLNRMDACQEEAIELQRNLTSRVALGPENGGTGEHEKMAYIQTVMESLNPDLLQEIHAPDSRAKDGYRPNLVSLWKGENEGRTVWVLSHADVVPPGDKDLWLNDPFVLKVEGDRLIGRGVEDNQHGLVSSFLGLKAILDAGRRPFHSVGLIVVADEETGSQYGLGHILKHHRRLFGPEDLIVVPDAGNEDGTMIEVAEKSLLWLAFTVKGRQCHASTPGKGQNSLLTSARLIVALQELHDLFPRSNPLFRPPDSTFSPTRILENVPNVNTIPGKDVFHIDCRVLPEYSLEQVLVETDRIKEAISAQTGLSIYTEVLQRVDAPEPTSPAAPVVERLKRAIHRVTGKEATAMGIGGATVAALFRQAGLAAAVWSTCPDTAHQPNEFCLLSHIIQDARVFSCLYLDEEGE